MSKFWRINFDRTMDYNVTPCWPSAISSSPRAAENTYVVAEHYERDGTAWVWAEKGHAWISPTFGEYWDLPAFIHKAFEACLTPNANGYTGLFMGDGIALCYECGIVSIMDPDDDDVDHMIDWGYQDNYSGMTCDACSQYIYEPHCCECGKDQSELDRSLYYNSSGDRCICRNCILEGWERANAIGDRKLNAPRFYTDLLAPGVYEVGRYDWRPAGSDHPEHYRSHRYGDEQRLYDYNEAERARETAS